MTLAVTAATRKTAILHIFRDCRVHWASAQIPRSAIMDAWLDVGLRQDDLEAGIDELLQEGSLCLVGSESDSVLRLTAAGEEWLDGPTGIRDSLARREQNRILRAVRSRMLARAAAAKTGKPVVPVAAPPPERPRGRRRNDRRSSTL
ncbi:MAG: hypothetical protein P4L83_22165 [Nevskia sp.]|nr:hypothetical protein [Nevskia sp.]